MVQDEGPKISGLRYYHFLIFLIYDNDISYMIFIIILMNNDTFSIKYLP